MADEMETVETTEEAIEQPAEELQVEEAGEEEESESKETFLRKMKDKIFGKKEEDTSTSGSEELEEDIDGDFEAAARQAGWTDNKIIEFAEGYSNKELRELIPLIADELEEEEEVVEQKEEKQEKVEGDKNLKDLEERLLKQLDDKYQEKIAQLEARLSDGEQERSVKAQLKFQTDADKFFDSVAKEFPVFGSTEQLARFPKGTKNAGQIVPVGEAFEARNQVWKTASAFHQMGMDWDESLQEAFSWYKGKNLESSARQKVLGELKKQEKRLSPKRSEKVVSRKFADAADEKKAIIQDIAAKAGIV